MPHFKNINTNELFWLDEQDDPAVWLQDCVEVSDEEASLLRSAALEAYNNTLTYAQKRAAEYPPITDYIDGIVKGDQAQVNAYITACLAVKAKYPK